MTKNDFTERKIPCREGPKLETYSCTPIVHCGSLIATATRSSSIARFDANASEETVEPETAAKQERSCGNVENGCSTECTWNRMGRSSNCMRRTPIVTRRRSLPTSTTQDHHGRNATKGTWSIVAYEFGKLRLPISHHGLGLRNVFSNLPLGNTRNARD